MNRPTRWTTPHACRLAALPAALALALTAVAAHAQTPRPCPTAADPDAACAPADATDLTNELYQSDCQYPGTHNFGTALYSRTFAVGLRYRF